MPRHKRHRRCGDHRKDKVTIHDSTFDAWFPSPAALGGRGE
jgi:hypothetical protein